MLVRKIEKRIFLLLLLALNVIIQNKSFAQIDNKQNKYANPKVVSFHPDSIQYQNLFDGEKDSVVFYSGVVTLIPNQSGEIHSTEIYEEMIITLEGEGQLRILNQKNLDVKFGKIALVPPFTKHQMVNTGTKNFKYIYVAAKSK